MSSEQDQIVINGNNLNSSVIKVLSEVCANLQKQYDISPKLITILINSLNVVQQCIKANEYGSETLKLQFQKVDELASIELKQSKNKDSMESSSQLAHHDASIISLSSQSNITGGNHEYMNMNMNNQTINLGWEGEKCGFLVKSYPNGFKRYCNEHKYLHTEAATGHEFVFKTNRQIIEERTCTIKLDYYQEYLNKLLEIFQDIMHTQIKKDYSIVRVKLEEVLNLNEWLKSREDCFKTKFISNAVTMPMLDGTSSGIRMEYGNYIDIYIPSDKLNNYLMDISKIGVNYVII